MTNRVKIFCYILVLLFFSSSPLFAQSPWEVETFDGAITNSGWYTDKFGPLQWPTDGLGNQAVRLEACASPSASSHCTSSTSSYGQESAVSTNHNVHAG